MILALILATYFILTISNQSTALRNSRRRYMLSCLRRGLLSKRDIVKVSHHYYRANEYYSNCCATYRDTFVSGRAYLSANGRLYRHVVNNGHKRVEFYQFGMIREELIGHAAFTPEYIRNNFTYNVSISSSTMFTICAPRMA